MLTPPVAATAAAAWLKVQIYVEINCKSRRREMWQQPQQLQQLQPTPQQPQPQLHFN